MRQACAHELKCCGRVTAPGVVSRKWVSKPQTHRVSGRRPVKSEARVELQMACWQWALVNTRDYLARRSRFGVSASMYSADCRRPDLFVQVQGRRQPHGLDATDRGIGAPFDQPSATAGVVHGPATQSRVRPAGGRRRRVEGKPDLRPAYRCANPVIGWFAGGSHPQADPPGTGHAGAAGRARIRANATAWSVGIGAQQPRPSGGRGANQKIDGIVR